MDTNEMNGRMKHNPKSFATIERKNTSKKNMRGSMRRTFSLQSSNSVDLAAQAAEISCNCLDHPGREFINKIFNLNINYLFECLFEKNDFDSRFAQLTKKYEMKKSNWYTDNGTKLKKFDYKIEINNPFINNKFCDNSQIMKILKAIPNELYVVETSNRTSGIPYSDCFSVVTRFCLVKYDTHLTKLLAHAAINFSSKPNFIIKNLIEKNGYASLQEHFSILCRSLEEESILKRNATPPSLSIAPASNSRLHLSPSPSEDQNCQEESCNQNDYSSSSSSRFSISSSSYSSSLSNGTESLLSSATEESGIAITAATSDEHNNMNHHHDDNPNHKRASKKKPQPQCTDSNTVRFRPKHASPHLIADLPQQQYPSLVLSPEFFVKAFFLLMLFLIGFNIVLFIKLLNIENITNRLISRQNNNS